MFLSFKQKKKKMQRDADLLDLDTNVLDIEQ